MRDRHDPYRQIRHEAKVEHMRDRKQEQLHPPGTKLRKGVAVGRGESPTAPPQQQLNVTSTSSAIVTPPIPPINAVPYLREPMPEPEPVPEKLRDVKPELHYPKAELSLPPVPPPRPMPEPKPEPATKSRLWRRRGR